MSDVEKVLHEYWRDLAEAFTYPLRADQLLGRFVSNPNVTGAYAEAWIRETVRSMVPQFRVSTGTVIRASSRTHDRPTPQCDLIIWDPSELPAIFETGDFAVVPIHSVRALIEVKRSCADPGEMLQQLDDRRKLLPIEYRHQLLGVVFRHPHKLFTDEVTPEWFTDLPDACQKPRITRLFSTQDWEPDVDGIFAFVYFLSQVSGHGVLPRKDP